MIDRPEKLLTGRVNVASWQICHDGKLFEADLYGVSLRVQYMADEDVVRQRHARGDFILPWEAVGPFGKRCFAGDHDARIWAENMVMLSPRQTEYALALRMLMDLDATHELRAIRLPMDPMQIHRHCMMTSALLHDEFLKVFHEPKNMLTRLWVTAKGREFVTAWSICKSEVAMRDREGDAL